MRARNRPFASSPFYSRAATFVAVLVTMILVCALPVAADWNAGVAAFQARDWNVAETEFQSVVETKPDWYGAHLMLGRTLLALDRPAEALQSLEHAWSLEAKPEIALLLAQTALQQERPELAAKALAADPPETLGDAHRARWFSLRARTSDEDAAKIADLERAVALTPQDADLRLALGDAALDAKLPALAVEHLEAARSETTDAGVLTRLVKGHLALAETQAGDARQAHCADAARAAVDLVELAGDAPHYRFAAGRALLCSGQPEAAEPHLARAAASSDDWLPAYDLARARLALQRWEDAEAALRPWTDGELDRKAEVKIHRLIGRALEGQQQFLDAIGHYEIAGDEDGIVHAREGQAALDHNERVKEFEKLQEEIDDVEGQLEATAEEESRWR